MKLKGPTDRLIEFFGRERLVDDLAADDFGALRSENAKNWLTGLNNRAE